MNSGPSVVDLKTVGRTYALAPTRYRSDDAADVRVAFTTTATVDHPVRVRTTLANAAEWPNTFRLDEMPPFGRRSGRIRERERDRELTYRSSLVFAPTEAHDLATHVPEVERGEDGTWRLAGEIDLTWTPDTVRLDAGETVTGEWYLVGRAGGGGEGRPTGRYEFRSGDTDLTVSVWNTDRPGPAGDSAFAGRSVPPLSEATDWYHDAGPETPAYLEPDRERVDLPGSVDLTLYNHTYGRLSGNSWNLYKLHEGAWYYLEPWAHTAVLRMIPAGGRRGYRLHAFSGETLPCEGAIGLGYLGGGTYAFESMYGSEDGPGHFAALLELRGPAVSVVPSEDATAERDGSAVTVEWPYRPELPRATLTVDRLGSELAAEERLLPEQVMRRRNRGLRNTLAYVEPGVDRVVLRSDRNTVSAASGASGYDPAVRRIQFEGDAFELRSTFGDDGADADERETATGSR